MLPRFCTYSLPETMEGLTSAYSSPDGWRGCGLGWRGAPEVGLHPGVTHLFLAEDQFQGVRYCWQLSGTKVKFDMKKAGDQKSFMNSGMYDLKWNLKSSSSHYQYKNLVKTWVEIWWNQNISVPHRLYVLQLNIRKAGKIKVGSNNAGLWKCPWIFHGPRTY